MMISHIFRSLRLLKNKYNKFFEKDAKVKLQQKLAYEKFLLKKIIAFINRESDADIRSWFKTFLKVHFYATF